MNTTQHTQLAAGAAATDVAPTVDDSAPATTDVAPVADDSAPVADGSALVADGSALVADGSALVADGSALAAVEAALAAADSSVRLRAALAVGSDPDPRVTESLIARCAVEPDFFVRDMLTWALCRLPAEVTVPRLIDELGSGSAQARSQALHTLSKVGDPRAWPSVSAQLHDADDEVVRSAWRAAVALVPAGEEAALAAQLVPELGRGDRDRQLSLSRAFAGLGEVVLPALDPATAHPDPLVRAHAEATRGLVLDPESSFTLSVEVAKRVAIAGPGVREEGA